jgi:hypothetical protein
MGYVGFRRCELDNHAEWAVTAPPKIVAHFVRLKRHLQDTSMKYIALVVTLFTSLVTTFAQINIGGDNGGASMRIGGGIGLSNGESQVTMFNPNQKGNFLFLFPQMTPSEAYNSIVTGSYASQNATSAGYKITLGYIA